MKDSVLLTSSTLHQKFHPRQIDVRRLTWPQRGFTGAWYQRLAVCPPRLLFANQTGSTRLQINSLLSPRHRPRRFLQPVSQGFSPSNDKRRAHFFTEINFFGELKFFEEGCREWTNGHTSTHARTHARTTTYTNLSIFCTNTLDAQSGTPV